MTIDIESREFANLYHPGLNNIITVIWDPPSLQLIKAEKSIEFNKSSYNIKIFNAIRLNPSNKSLTILIKFTTDLTQKKLIIDGIKYPKDFNYEISVIDKQ